MSNHRPTCYYYLTHRGFFSEIYQLVNAVLYCKEHHYDLIVMDACWNAKKSLGLRDYFQCEHLFSFKESPNLFFLPNFLESQTWRSRLKEIQAVYFFKTQKKGSHGFFTISKSLFAYIACFLTDKCHNKNFEVMGHILSPNSWSNHWNNIVTQFEENRILPQGESVIYAKHYLLTQLWSFSTVIQQYIQSQPLIHSLDSYASIHIRRGDKIVYETKEIPLNVYLHVLKKYSKEKKLFIGTDDPTIIEKIKTLEPQFEIFHHDFPSEHPHDQTLFNNQTPHEIYNQTKALLFEMEMHRKAKVFIGTISSNISKVLAYLRNDPKTTFSLDRRDRQPIFDELVTYVKC